jgi:hypothetical protein
MDKSLKNEVNKMVVTEDTGREYFIKPNQQEKQ